MSGVAMVDVSAYLRFLAALLFVLGLIALVAWLVRRFRLGGALPGNATRRLAVVESLAIDTRRRLMLVSCDGREHLLLLTQDGAVRLEGGCSASPPAAPAGRDPS